MDTKTLVLVGIASYFLAKRKVSSIGSVKSIFNPRDADELYIYIKNDYDTYKRLQPLYENLVKKYKKGIYDENKAWKIFVPIVDEVSRKLRREYGSDYGFIFNRATKDFVCRQLASATIDYIDYI